MRPPSFHVVPRGSAWSIRRAGSKRTLANGLQHADAWRDARAMADQVGAIAYRFDKNCRIVEAYAAEPDIAAVNMKLKKAITDTGKLCDITNLFDADGDDTGDADEAAVAVARLDDDHWFAIDLAVFAQVRPN